MSKQNNTPTEDKKEYYSFENVDLSIKQLFDLVQALQNNTATEEQLQQLFNNSDEVSILEK